MNRNLRLLAAVAVLVALVAAGAAGLLGGSSGSGSTTQPTPTVLANVSTDAVDPTSGLPVIPASGLPPEALTTLSLIDRGGPFPYSEDGIVFGNYEGILPDESHGYYHEYTVVTPGASTRGARRIITGSQGEFYFTADHYASFYRIDRSS